MERTVDKMRCINIGQSLIADHLEGGLMDIFAQAKRMMTTTPLISLAVWSRVWLGWYSLLPIGLSLLWTWYNPRAFPPPKSTNNWGSKATFGERIFLDRKKVDIPSHHLPAANILTVMSLVGALIWFYGLYALDFWAVVAGMIGTVLPKAWFGDRRVWIYEDMKNEDPIYSSWLI